MGFSAPNTQPQRHCPQPLPKHWPPPNWPTPQHQTSPKQAPPNPNPSVLPTSQQVLRNQGRPRDLPRACRSPCVTHTGSEPARPPLLLAKKILHAQSPVMAAAVHGCPAQRRHWGPPGHLILMEVSEPGSWPGRTRPHGRNHKFHLAGAGTQCALQPTCPGYQTQLKGGIQGPLR